MSITITTPAIILPAIFNDVTIPIDFYVISINSTIKLIIQGK